MENLIEQLTDTVREAASKGEALRIRGSGSKDFYGGPLAGTVLNVGGLTGVEDYEPTELVLTVRAGTPLAEVEKLLAEHGQMLPFEPPHFGPGATVGGCVAAGLSGPRRAYTGSVRDYVLGLRIVDGRGDVLKFGGQVMKNVAGYDVSRLMVGAMGTLGLILDVSFKVLPQPAEETTLRLAMGQQEALETINRWAGRPLPLSASCYREGALAVRLSGAASAVGAARAKLGGDEMAPEAARSFWQDIRNQRDSFFQDGAILWRISLPSTQGPLALPGDQLIEWGGALRWLKTEADAAMVREAAAAAGGQATLFRGGDKGIGVFHPLARPLAGIHERLKRTFDPQGIFNRGRLYPTF